MIDRTDPVLSALGAAIWHQAATGALSASFAEHWVMLAARHLLRLDPSAPDGPAPVAHAGIARAVDCIEARLDADLSLRQLADTAGLSLFHFARCFRAQVGTTPHSYILARRIERAKHLLARGELPLAEIALAVGFSSQSHLTTAFRRATGVTPARWRSQD